MFYLFFSSMRFKKKSPRSEEDVTVLQCFANYAFIRVIKERLFDLIGNPSPSSFPSNILLLNYFFKELIKFQV